MYTLHGKLLVEAIEYEVDLGAEKLLAANKGTRKILVEVKSFLKHSKTYEMHQALGQYNTYLLALEYQKLELELFLAVPLQAYQDFFQNRFIQELLYRYRVRLLIFEPNHKTIIKWI